MCLSRLISHEPSKSSKTAGLSKSQHSKIEEQVEFMDTSKEVIDLFENNLKPAVSPLLVSRRQRL